MKPTNKIGARLWSSILMFGLFGQLAWVVENMYFNLFLYNTISGSPEAIAWMVACSAATATITTMLMGAFSDKLKKRKLFISVGYIFWGLSTLSFAFISIDNVQVLFPYADAVKVAIAVVIIMDCVMTFFGSTANDSAFNAWVTDSTNVENRGKVEGVLAILPLLALLVIFGGFDGFVQSDQWPLFFFILGGLITLGGVIGIFLIRESNVESSHQDYFKALIHGFRPSTVKENKNLYLYLAVMGLFGISTQIYMPFFIIYIQRYLGINSYAILLGAVLLGASVVSVLVGRGVNGKNKSRYFVPGLGIMFVGLLLLFLTRSPIWVGIAGFVMMSGNLILTAVVSAKVRDYTPLDKVGHFQGIRMIFFVLIPMLIGPFIGAQVIHNSATFYEDLGVLKPVPTPEIFLVSAILSLLVLIPLFFVFHREKEASK